MKILPIASDSLGVRSMATYVETEDCKILIDPSAAIASKRYGLPPSKEETDMLKKTKQEIAEIAKDCNILTISHYHYDHFETDKKIYKGKKVYTKDINNKINKSQKQRGTELKNNISDICELEFCDDSKYNFGKTLIKFSKPFFHGPDKIRLGYVIMTTVDDSNKKSYMHLMFKDLLQKMQRIISFLRNLIF